MNGRIFTTTTITSDPQSLNNRSIWTTKISYENPTGTEVNLATVRSERPSTSYVHSRLSYAEKDVSVLPRYRHDKPIEEGRYLTSNDLTPIGSTTIPNCHANLVRAALKKLPASLQS